MTARWLSWWQPADSPFPAVIAHATQTAAEAHALFVQATTGCTVHVRVEESR